MRKCEKKGHKFEARYDEMPSNDKITIWDIHPDDLRKLRYYNVYVRDICIRCGKVINRQ